MDTKEQFVTEHWGDLTQWLGKVDPGEIIKHPIDGSAFKVSHPGISCEIGDEQCEVFFKTELLFKKYKE